MGETTKPDCWHIFEAAMEGDCPCKLCGETEPWNYAFGYMISRSRAMNELTALRTLRDAVMKYATDQINLLELMKVYEKAKVDDVGK